MSPEQERLRDTIIYEAFERFESDREAREQFAREQCLSDSDVLSAVLADLQAEEEIRNRAFLLNLAGSGSNGTIPKGTVIGEYTIDTLIGSGGMGTVYEAQQARLQRAVAIKFLHTRLAASAAERFLSEARYLSAVQSERVVHVYAYDHYNGDPYLVMEYVRGINLADAIRDGRCGDLKSRIEIALQIAEGIEDIHQAGIAHRDVKPSNVLVQASRKIKLLDFGIAWRQDSQLTRAGQQMGTPAYMAPEQILRILGGPAPQESDRYKRADIYSYGILLYELLTSRLPFSGDTQGEIENNILHQPLPLEPLWEASVPGEVVQLIQAATARKPQQRPESCRWIAQQLAAVVALLPKHEVFPQETKGFRRRGRTAAGAIVAIGACTAIQVLWSPRGANIPSQPNSSITLQQQPRSEIRARQSEVVTSTPTSVSANPTANPLFETKTAPREKLDARPIPATPGQDLALTAIPDSPLLDKALRASLDNPIALGNPQLTISAATPTALEPSELPQWTKVRDSGDAAALHAFAQANPGSRFAHEALERAAELEWQTLRSSHDPEALRRFAHRFAESPRAILATNLARQWEARTAASSQVFRTLERYAQAYSNRDLNAVAELRVLSPNHRKLISDMFKDSRSVRLTIRPAPPLFTDPVTPERTGPDVVPQVATVRAAFQLSVQSIDGETSPPLARDVVYTLRRSGQTWTIAGESTVSAGTRPSDRP